MRDIQTHPQTFVFGPDVLSILQGIHATHFNSLKLRQSEKYAAKTLLTQHMRHSTVLVKSAGCHYGESVHLRPSPCCMLLCSLVTVVVSYRGEDFPKINIGHLIPRESVASATK